MLFTVIGLREGFDVVPDVSTDLRVRCRLTSRILLNGKEEAGLKRSGLASSYLDVLKL